MVARRKRKFFGLSAGKIIGRVNAPPLPVLSICKNAAPVDRGGIAYFRDYLTAYRKVTTWARVQV